MSRDQGYIYDLLPCAIRPCRELAGKVGRACAAKKIHPSMQFLLHPSTVHVKDVLVEGKDQCVAQMHRQKPSASGCPPNPESSSREAGHELFPLASPCSLPDCPLPIPWGLNQVLAPCSEGLPAGLTLFCDSPSSEGNFSDEPIENLTSKFVLVKKARKRLLLGLPDKWNCSQQPGQMVLHPLFL